MNLELDGRVALVSGCSQGLGYACVRTLARHGADIFGVSIGDDSALKKEVEALGRSYHSLTVSLTTPGSIHDVMKEVLAAYGHVDILLNFAGILKKEDTLEISRQALSKRPGYQCNCGVYTFPGGYTPVYSGRGMEVKSSMHPESCPMVPANTVPISPARVPWKQ